jgi:hypothetical protein
VVIDRFALAVCTGELESVAVTVNEEVPVPVGAPEMIPLDGSRLRPAGRLPLVTDQL